MYLFGSIGQRLREERKKAGLSQTEIAEMTASAGVSGATRQSQSLYEKGERIPDVAYLSVLSAAGLDIRYIVTGERDGPPPEVLSADERYLLARYRSSPAPLRDAALRVLLGGDPPASRRGQTIIHGTVGQSMGDNHAPMTINMDNRKK